MIVRITGYIYIGGVIKKVTVFWIKNNTCRYATDSIKSLDEYLNLEEIDESSTLKMIIDRANENYEIINNSEEKDINYDD